MKKDLIQMIKQRPDCSITKIVYSCGIGYSEAKAILKELEEDGLVEKQENTFTRYNLLRGRPAAIYSVC